MPAKLIKGDEVAARLRKAMTEEIGNIFETTGLIPCLALVYAGEDRASLFSARVAHDRTDLPGFDESIYKLPADVPESDLIRLITELNDDGKIHGIYVRLPLPAHIDSRAVLESIDPEKDVDGVHPINLGKLFSNETGFGSAAANSVLQMIDYTKETIFGKAAVLIGGNNGLTEAMSLLMLRRDATITICPAFSPDAQAICLEADILVAAGGNPGYLKGDWIKPGAIVIDAGETEIAGNPVGDLDFNSVNNVAGWISPVPGGVGSVIKPMLQWNTIAAFKKSLAE